MPDNRPDMLRHAGPMNINYDYLCMKKLYTHKIWLDLIKRTVKMAANKRPPVHGLPACASDGSSADKIR